MPADNQLDPDNVSRIVMLTYGRMTDGKSSYWCYVAVKPSEYDKFMDVLKTGKLNLHTYEDDGYGEVLVSGPGLYPPANITREVALAFNMKVKELFSAEDPKSVITQKIEELKRKISGSETAS